MTFMYVYISFLYGDGTGVRLYGIRYWEYPIYNILYSHRSTLSYLLNKGSNIFFFCIPTTI